MLEPPQLEPPTIARRRRWPHLVMVAAAVAACAVWRVELGAWIAGDRGAPPADEAVALYTCSMDPSVESPHPGSCPICGMALTPVSREDRASGIVRIGTHVRQQIGLEVATIAARPLRTRAVASGVVVGPPAAGRAAVVARIYRGQADELAPGHPVSVAALDLPITQFTGALGAALPGDPPGALRAEVGNPDDALRPGMHVEVAIDVDLPPRLVVPAEAVLVAGARRIVFVDLGGDRFEPRTPRLGAQAAGFVEVLEGLATGDRVVVHGTFLLAAENRIRSDGALWTERKEPPARPIPRGGP